MRIWQSALLGAALLAQPNIEEALRNYPITEECKQKEWLDWIWEPFEEPANSALPIIAGRIAYLISEVPFELSNTESSLALDPRLIVPICAIEKIGEIQVTALKKFKERVSELEQDAFQPTFPQRQMQFVNGTWIKVAELQRELAVFQGENPVKELKQCGVQPTFTQQQVDEIFNNSDISLGWRKIVSTQTPSQQFDLLRRLVKYRLPTINDWRNIFRPVKYDFRTGWHYQIICYIATVVSVVALIQMIYLIAASPQGWMTCFTAVAAFVVLNFLLFLWKLFIIWPKVVWREDFFEYPSEPDLFLSVGLLGIVTTFQELAYFFRKVLFPSKTKALIITLPSTLALIVATILAIIGAIVIFVLLESKTIIYALGVSIFTCTFLGIINLRLESILSQLELVDVTNTNEFEYEELGFFGRLFAVLAAPLSWWFPIVLYFATVAMLNFGSWQQVALIWLTLMGTCTVLWVIGKKRDREARNPLHGIIPNPTTAGKT